MKGCQVVRSERLDPLLYIILFERILITITEKHHLHQITSKMNENVDTYSAVNFLNIWTPEKSLVITLKFELYGSTIE